MNRFLRTLCVALSVAFVGWMGAIYYLSSQSGKVIEQMNTFNLWDKGAHFLAFATGGLLLAAAFRAGTDWRGWVLWRRTVLALALFAASDEWHQTFTPGRSGGDVEDWLADLCGVAFGAALVKFWHPRRNLPPARADAPAEV